MHFNGCHAHAKNNFCLLEQFECVNIWFYRTQLIEVKLTFYQPFSAQHCLILLDTDFILHGIRASNPSKVRIIPQFIHSSAAIPRRLNGKLLKQICLALFRHQSSRSQFICNKPKSCSSNIYLIASKFLLDRPNDQNLKSVQMKKFNPKPRV